jgi:hypothetical protein
MASSLPIGPARNRIIVWTWLGIAAAVGQMMIADGKNAD